MENLKIFYTITYSTLLKVNKFNFEPFIYMDSNRSASLTKNCFLV